MFKKVLAIIFIVIGCILSFASLAQIPMVVGTILRALAKSSSTYDVGYSAGRVIAFLIILAMVFVFFKFGFKWLRKPAAQYNQFKTLDEDLVNRQDDY